MLVFQFLCLPSTLLAKSQISFILYWTLGSFQLQNSKKFSIKYLKRVLFMLVLWIYLFLVTIWMSYTPFISNFYSMTLLYCCHSIGISKMITCREDAKNQIKNAIWFYHRCKCLLYIYINMNTKKYLSYRLWKMKLMIYLIFF